MAEYKLAALQDRDSDNEAYITVRPPLDEERKAALIGSAMMIAWEYESAGETLFQLYPRVRYDEQNLQGQLALAADALASFGDTAEVEPVIRRSNDIPADGMIFHSVRNI